MEQRPNNSTFIAYCDYIRKAFPAKGILIYDEKAGAKIKVIGYPYPRRGASNDNEAKR